MARGAGRAIARARAAEMGWPAGGPEGRRAGGSGARGAKGPEAQRTGGPRGPRGPEARRPGGSKGRRAKGPEARRARGPGAGPGQGPGGPDIRSGPEARMAGGLPRTRGSEGRRPRSSGQECLEARSGRRPGASGRTELSETSAHNNSICQYFVNVFVFYLSPQLTPAEPRRDGLRARPTTAPPRTKQQNGDKKK